VVNATTVLAGSLFHTEAVEPHHFGLPGHAVGFVDDDDLPVAAGHRPQVHAPQQVFDRADVLRAAGDVDHAAPVGIAAQFVASAQAAVGLPTPLEPAKMKALE